MQNANYNFSSDSSASDEQLKQVTTAINEPMPTEQVLDNMPDVRSFKPVDKMVIENENLIRRTLPDGRPVPRRYRVPIRCRIYPTMLSCYSMFSMTITMCMLGSFIEAVMKDWEEPHCFDNVGIPTAILFGVLAMNSGIGVILCLFSVFLRRSNRQYLEHR